MIQLINGSIFGTKCDLLVVPANNLGGVADSVYEELSGNGLPYLHRSIPVGDIEPPIGEIPEFIKQKFA